MGKNLTGFEIAVIGMYGRFPGADTIEEFWNNLINGVESITFFSDEQLRKEPNIGAGLVKNTNSVNAGGILQNKDSFDAAFFEYSPKEVEIMDPQMRVLHECVWSALEDAGYSPGYKGLIGLYAGASPHFYWEALSTLTGKVNDFGIFAAQQLFDKDFLTTQISYKLDLKGPSVTLYTACSTSLVAIHMACRALIGGECDLALAGGVSISSHDRSENRYQEGMIVSPDGHCRSFDAEAQGTVFGEGAGIIVLKPLENAIKDNDYIHAVIKSTAINNDGKRKVGYTAPSIQGQAEVIRAALELAEVGPESISYVEAHGTGTVLGDPIEIEALKLAFHTNKRGYCGIGSVKTNIGHLDAAAGVVSVIKTILAMKHKIIPKNLHFQTPNPQINFQESPFFVVKELKKWEHGAHPVRAGINSFGIGGTNAHLILEEAPQIEDTPEDATRSRPYQILVLSAKTTTALDQLAENLAEHLRKNPGLNLADIAYTLQTGREAFRYRRTIVCSDIDEAVELLSSAQGKENISLIKEEKESSDGKYLLSKLGDAWLSGLSVDWAALYSEEKRKRLPLPTYPFEKRSYTIKGDLLKLGGISQHRKLTKNPNIADWFSVPSWKRTIIPPQSAYQPSIQHNWLIFTDEIGLGSRIITRLKAQNQQVTMVKARAEFSKTDDQEYSINPEQDSDYSRLFECLRKEGNLPGKIVHLWTLSDDSGNDDKDHTPELVAEYNNLGFYSLLGIARAIGKASTTASIQVKVITNHLHEVTGHDLLSPCKATVLGPLKVIPHEFPNIHCSCIDIEWPGPGGNNAVRMVEILGRELASETPDMIIAYRGNHRWVQIFEPARLAKPGDGDIRLKDAGVYLITGGLGGIGLVLAGHLAQTKKARLILTGRSFFPARNDWDEWLKSHDQEDKTSIRIRKVQELEKLGGKVSVFRADVSNKLQMQQVITGAKEYFGGIDGVIHAAGTPDSGVIQLRSREKSEEVFSSKITGFLILDTLVRENSITVDFFLFCSSLASILPPFGQVAYCAANIFLDTYACFKVSQGGPVTISLNWDTWQETGMAFETMKELSAKGYSLEKGILPSEGVEAFRYVLESALSNVAVSTTDLQMRIEQMHTLEDEKSKLLEAFEEDPPSGNYLPRPELRTEYLAPMSEVERRLARIWKDYLGFKEIGIQDNFFELGGDSLKAVMIIAKIHEELNSEPPLAIFFDNPTIQSLADYLENSQRKMYRGIEPVEKRKYYPQSSAQKRLFIINQFDNVGVAYNLFLVKKLEGTFDKDRFEKAIEALIERHEILRTSFTIIHDEPVQIVHDRIDFAVRYYELDEKEMKQEERIRELSQDFYQPFDLSCAPLFRIACARIAPDNEFYFILQMHHIITDGSSGNILYNDLLRFYRGEKPKPLQIQYKDFVCWQNILIEKGQFKEQEEYWTNLFSGGIPRLDLPLDFPRPDFFLYRGESYTLMLDQNTTSQLKNLCLQHEATLFMTLLATLNILFHKYTGMEDIVIGSIVAGRRYHPELQDLTGFFINVLAMRNYPGTDKTFFEFLKEVKKNSIRAYENQEFQFEELIDRLNIERDPSRNPLFDVCFVVQNFQDRSARMLQPNEMKVLSLFKEHVEGTTLFDLDIEASESGDKIQVDIKYCTALLRQETIERLAGHWRNIMNQVCLRPDMRIADIELLSENEKRTILFDFNRTEVKYPENTTICDLFEEQADRVPDKVAVIYKDYSITYQELDEKSNQVANYLHSAIHIRAESRIGILMDKSIEVIIAVLGIWKAGGAYVPLDPSLPYERIRDIIDDAGICHILSQKKYLTVLNQLHEQCPSVKAFLYLDRSDTGLPQRYSKERLNLAISPEHLAYVIYTSGSTGKPRGVMVEHRQYVNAAYAWRDVYRLRSQDSEVNLLQIAGISFDVFAGDLAKALVNGGKLIICPDDLYLDFEGMYALIKNHRVSLFESTPALIIPFMDYVYTLGLNIDSLQLLILGSDTCNAEDFRTLRLRFGDRMRIINSYGVTEATIDTSCYEESPGKLPQSATVPIGRPLPNMTCYILDENEKLQPIGVPGELSIGGAGVSRGYLSQEELTKERFRENPYIKGERVYKTADLAKWLPDGTLAFLGRSDYQVKIRGYRIEPAEIEAKLKGHSGIKEAVVIAGEDNAGEKYLCAYVVGNRAIEAQELEEHLSQSLPRYMIPSFFIHVEKIPLTPHGKVDRKALPLPEIAAGQKYSGPRDGIEEKLVEIWSEILKKEGERISIDANFFHLGGHSLKATILASRIHKVFEIKVPLNIIFKYPTIEEIAKYLKGKEKDQYLAIRPADQREYYLLSSAQKRLYILQQFEENSISYNIPLIFPLAEGLDKERLEDILKKLITRHESLRTSFEIIDDEPVQKIHQEVPFSIEYCETDESDLDTIRSNLTKAFHLSQAPLVRAIYVQMTSTSRAAGFIDMHHIINAN